MEPHLAENDKEIFYKYLDNSTSDSIWQHSKINIFNIMIV